MTKIKICGITNLQDGVAAIEMGADMLGFNFYSPSPRSITPEKCAPITSMINKEFPKITLVGVFVNFPVQQIKFILQSCSLHAAQLHGDETAGMLAAFPGNAYKAFRGAPTRSIISEYLQFSSLMTPSFLVDASVHNLYGGSGTTTDWFAAADLAREFPILLAGGLTPDNVSKSLTQVHPWGVDTASGVESKPGVKDIFKIRAFIDAVRTTNM